jgi:hypothetical protein
MVKEAISMNGEARDILGPFVAFLLMVLALVLSAKTFIFSRGTGRSG